MTILDLSAFAKNFVPDNAEELSKISSINGLPARIGVGVHEVTISSLYEKLGAPFRVVDQAGGALQFSVIIKNKDNEEQMVGFTVPLQITFSQSASLQDKRTSFLFKKTISDLMGMQIRLEYFREALIKTNGEAARLLIGTKFILENKWNPKKVHLEYNSSARGYYFTKANGERFTDGELAVPVHIDKDKKWHERFVEAMVIAKECNQELALNMETIIRSHPSETNEKVNEALLATFQSKEKKPFAFNTTKNPFQPKKITAPVDFEPDVEMGE